MTEQIHQIAEQIRKKLMEVSETSAWELKIALKIPNSLLYMALGILIREGFIQLSQDGFTYKVRYLPSLSKQEAKQSRPLGSDHLSSVSQDV
ncbi:MAG: hypothetical protein HY400_05875 [Elusimicrobia bacterium]|nr:hypothetical protein [Elusimicrobiota bacterium]